MEEKNIHELLKLIRGLDAKINTVAAYVAALPGAAGVDRAAIENSLRAHRWTPNSPFSAPSEHTMASTMLTALIEAAASKGAALDEKPPS